MYHLHLHQHIVSDISWRRMYCYTVCVYLVRNMWASMMQPVLGVALPATTMNFGENMLSTTIDRFELAGWPPNLATVSNHADDFSPRKRKQIAIRYDTSVIVDPSHLFSSHRDALNRASINNINTMKTISTDNKEGDEDLQYILNQLTLEELEIAARAAYEYHRYSCTCPTQDDDDNAAVPDDDRSFKNRERLRYASAMAQRYLDSKSDRDTALQFMKATIQFRKDLDIDNLRNAATDTSSDYHTPLIKFLSTKQSFVQGYDCRGRSTYIFVPRMVREHDPEWTRKGHVWSLERAIACSRAPDKTVNVVVDFSGFSVLSHAPPPLIGKDIMLTLRNHYVGHVHRILLVDAPPAFTWLWAFFKKFAGSKTRNKIHFVNSDLEKETLIGELYAADEAASWMLPTGKKNRKLDLDEYLQETPFDQAFDE